MKWSYKLFTVLICCLFLYVGIGAVSADTLSVTPNLTNPDISTNASVIVNFTATGFNTTAGTTSDKSYWTIRNLANGIVWNGSDSPNMKTLIYPFTKTGIYNVSCTGYNNSDINNPIDYGNMSITVNQTLVGLRIDKTTPYNNNVTYTYIPKTGSAKADHYFWNFGDGTSDQTIVNTTTHRYSDNCPDGCNINYQVKAYATNESSFHPKSSELTLDVSYNGSPNVSFTSSVDAVNRAFATGTYVQFTNNVESCAGSTAGTDYNYTFNLNNGTSYKNLPTPGIGFSVPGRYNISLNVSDKYGEAIVNHSFIVYDPITPNFTYNQIAPDVFPIKVKFTDTSSGSNVDKRTFTIDGIDVADNITTNTYTHTFNKPGKFSVNMTAFNTTYGINAISEQDVAIDGLYANFTASAVNVSINRGGLPAIITFTNTSAGVNENTKFLWDFDANGANVKPPFSSSNTSQVVEFYEKGEYNVSLMVTNPGIGNSTMTKQISIVENLQSNFTYAPSTGSFPLTVKFTDLSTDSPRAWYWEFYDKYGSISGISKVKDPEWIYSEPGKYLVNLTTTADSSNTISKYINLGSPVSIGLKADPIKGLNPLAVIFNGTSNGADVDVWSWNFGDGQTSSAQNVSHTYDNMGIYTVKLTGTNITLNSTDTKQQTINVNSGINPDFDVKTDDCPTYKVNATFSDNSSGMSIDKWIWDFGDKTTPKETTNSKITHMYEKPGNYTVNMTIQNTTYDLSASLKEDIDFYGLYADISTNPSGSQVIKRGGEPVVFKFNATVMNVEGKSPRYEWNFGKAPDVDPEISFDQNTSAKFYKAGTYPVTLKVTTVCDSWTFQAKVTVTEELESAFDYSPKYGAFPYDVTFTDLSTDTPDRWLWTFYDKNGKPIGYNSSKTAVQSYSESGSYLVNLTTYNSETGKSNSTNTSITLYPNIALKITPDKQSGSVPLSVNFNATQEAGPKVDTWNWNFAGVVGTENKPNVSYTFNYADVCHVILNVENKTFGAKGFADTSITVVGPIKADFKPSGTYPVDDLKTVNFTDLTSPETADTWLWDFGDKSTSNEQNPSHQFSAFGKYNVTLKVSDSVYGVTDTVKKEINLISNKVPVANFIVTPEVASIGQPVAFSSSGSGENIISYAWDFGDGYTGEGITASHVYTESGFFNVSLNVTNQFGSDTKTIPAAVKVKGFTPSFDSIPSGWGSVNSSIYFFDTSKGEAVQWMWDFGDGTLPVTTTKDSVEHTYSRIGDYLVIMNATNWEGITKSVSGTFTVVDKEIPRKVDFKSANGETFPVGKPPLSIEFVDTTPAQSDVTSRYWEFGDGSNLIEEVPFSEVTKHEYTTPGMYTVSLTCKNDNGVTDVTKVVYVVVLDQ